MAQLDFYAGENLGIDNQSGSGLGFFGGNFGFSVAVGEYQDTTFITDGNGVNEGPQCDNIKWLNIGSGIINSAGSGDPLTAIPNYLSSLNITFTHGTAVKTQNAEVRIYDRSNIDNDPSGVTCKVAEVIHPNTTKVNDGSGDTTWITPHGSAVTVSLAAAPGESGLSPNGPSTTDLKHDWYLAISASPDSIGSKTQFGLYVTLEYL